MEAIDVLKYLLTKAESEVPEGHRIIELNVPVDIVREIIDAQPETYDLTANIENVLALLDGIHSSGRMEYYSDYCALHDAIAGLLPG